MNSDYETRLEQAIHRELRNLPELTAPETLLSRVTAVLEQRAAIPWYRRSWPTWPRVGQAGSLAVLLILFAGIYLAGVHLSQTELCRAAASRAGDVISGFHLVGNTFDVLTGALVLVVRKLGTAFIVACLLTAGLAYSVCVGLGTVYFRLAFVKR